MYKQVRFRRRTSLPKSLPRIFCATLPGFAGGTFRQNARAPAGGSPTCTGGAGILVRVILLRAACAANAFFYRALHVDDTRQADLKIAVINMGRHTVAFEFGHEPGFYPIGVFAAVVMKILCMLQL